jgi:hypothetical protein
VQELLQRWPNSFLRAWQLLLQLVEQTGAATTTVVVQLVVQPWQRLPNSLVRAWQLLEQLAALEQLVTTVVVQLVVQLQRLRPKSAVSLPAVKASINTAEYIFDTSCKQKGKPTHASIRQFQSLESLLPTCPVPYLACLVPWQTFPSVENSKDS